jgi:molybdopterin molybdotransferase
MREADWLLIGEALEIMLRAVEPCDAEEVSLDAAAGRTLAEPIISPIDHPPWDNSAMDGYAVLATDVRGASAAEPVALRVIEDVPAGARPEQAVSPGLATRIMTGAPLPPGADSVVRVEHTRLLDTERIEVFNDFDAGRNVRARAEDVRAGETVLTPGRVLCPADVGVLAMLGHTRPRVTRRPHVAVLATGNELVEPDRLEAVVAGTHIINSNTPAVAAALRESGCTALPLGIARDELSDLRPRLRQAIGTDALITTAGASVGEHDLVKDALEEIGCKVHFWRVKIRPGSPFSFGVVPREDGPGLPVFGLPGNPVSALVTFEILVKPVLRRMLRRAAVYPFTFAAVAGADIRSPPGLVRFLRVRLEHRADEPPHAYLTGPQGSGILTSVAAADGLLVVPIDVEVIRQGEPVRVVPLRLGEAAQETPGF